MRSRSAAATTSSSLRGVGYRLDVSAETLSHVPRIGEPVTLFTHLIVREDAMTLIGFATEEERDLFLLLIGVQGVGPKMALAVLSGGPPRELLAAVAASDTARLLAVPGHRQAHRGADHRRAQDEDPDVHDDPITVTRRADDPRALARDGLVGLGFAPQEIDKLLEGAAGDTPEALITHALKVSRR